MNISESIHSRFNRLYKRCFRLEKFQDKMSTEEVDKIFYFTEGLGMYIDKIINCKGSLQFIMDNTLDNVQKILDEYEILVPKLELKYK